MSCCNCNLLVSLLQQNDRIINLITQDNADLQELVIDVGDIQTNLNALTTTINSINSKIDDLQCVTISVCNNPTVSGSTILYKCDVDLSKMVGNFNMVFIGSVIDPLKTVSVIDMANKTYPVVAASTSTAILNSALKVGIILPVLVKDSKVNIQGI